MDVIRVDIEFWWPSTVQEFGDQVVNPFCISDDDLSMPVPGVLGLNSLLELSGSHRDIG